MDQYLQRKRPVPLQQATALTNSILTMLVKDMRPMSMVDGEGFREMIRQFNPEYILPSRTHFTHLMEKKYEATLLKVKETIKEVKSALTLTADVWTSRATEAYLGVSCHFISEDWEMKTLNLATMPLEERHSGVNIMTWLEEVIAKYDILPTKIKAVVHDNGGHTLQLIVNNALKEPSISRAVGAARHLPDQWVLLEELTQGLQPFQCATVYLSGQEYATASCLPQLVKGLQRSTQQTRFETGAGKAFLATSLDPRFRKLKFMGAEDGTRVQGTIEVLAIKESDTDSLSEEEDESHEDQKLQMARSEVQMYFAEPAIHKKDDPLRWWRENKGRFPVLSKLARSFLCIPATSTPSERIFSVAGNICSQKRASLSGDHVEMLTFLHFNPE
ncbi:Zinc finger BED domain containing protein 1 [Dissostichus eleginoides]|uniref:Zinc finger BED domain containing protein 1 n=1 Tax=Dissostichus eleginoides TaxID=100907 RepID=A0AAD9BU80_DISEL|nr:Zinc finger BED domain containing protein 1 [Dissostichus eleginoides]